MKVESDKIIIPKSAPVKVLPDTKIIAATTGDLIGIEEKVKAESKPSPNISPPMFSQFSLIRQFLLLDQIPADPDLQRYNDILKGKAREDLKKFKTPGEMLGIKGGNIVSIPVPKIGIPHFTRGNRQAGGAGQGEGEEGQVIGQTDDETGQKAGDQAGGHIIEVEMTLSEVAEAIIQDRKLPYLQPKGYGVAKEKAIKWNTKSRVGIDLDLQSTIVNALKRVGSEIGDKFDIETDEGLNALLDQVAIEDVDKVYNSWREIEKPQVSAVIIYMMDVSGSVTDEMKEKVRKAARWLSLIIQYQFGKVRADLRGEKFENENLGEGVEEVFIIHDAAAQEVSEHDFYHTRESGGTRISSAYQLAQKIIEERYDPDTWNVYAFHFSDGDNWGDDIPHAIDLIKQMAERINEFGYIQVESTYGSGEFYGYVKEFAAEGHPHVRFTKVEAAGNEGLDKVIDSMLGEEEKKS